MPLNFTFEQLWNNYPTPNDEPFESLYKELGWDDLISKPEYRNTCAVRTHLALLRSGFDMSGRLQIKKGALKGKWIEPGQAQLSKKLAQDKLFGPPQKFKPSDKDKELQGRQGIVSFMNIPGYPLGNGRLGGHIDLVKNGKFLYFFDTLVCQSNCYWDASDVWFWPVS